MMSFIKSFNGKVTARDLYFSLNIMGCTLESIKNIDYTNK